MKSHHVESAGELVESDDSDEEEEEVLPKGVDSTNAGGAAFPSLRNDQLFQKKRTYQVIVESTLLGS